jgi:hypothetical protein
MDDAMPIVVYRNVWNLETLGVGHQARNLPRREAIREWVASETRRHGMIGHRYMRIAPA